MQKLTIAVALAVTLAGATSALAQTYPSRPITMIVPANAGGPTDTIGRILAQRMQVTLGQNVIIENIGGASGTLGTSRVVRAAADGYTIGLGGWNHYVVNGAVYPLQYDLLADFAPVSLIASGPQLILSKKDIPANNLQELIAWLKARPDSVTFGTGGVAAPGTSAGCRSRTSPARNSCSCRTAALGRQCRTWWPGRSTSPSTSPPARCRR